MESGSRKGSRRSNGLHPNGKTTRLPLCNNIWKGIVSCDSLTGAEMTRVETRVPNKVR